MFTFFFVVSVADESDEESEKTVRVQINEWMDASDFKATPTNKLDVSKTVHTTTATTAPGGIPPLQPLHQVARWLDRHCKRTNRCIWRVLMLFFFVGLSWWVGVICRFLLKGKQWQRVLSLDRRLKTSSLYWWNAGEKQWKKTVFGTFLDCTKKEFNTDNPGCEIQNCLNTFTEQHWKVSLYKSVIRYGSG